MTREEWINENTTLDDLIYWCRENGYGDYFEDYINEDLLDECVNEDICNYDCHWTDLRDALNDIDTSYTWYRCHGTLSYEGVSDWDFEDIRDSVEDMLDGDDYFDEESDDEEEQGSNQTNNYTQYTVEDECELDEVDIGLLSQLCTTAWEAMEGARTVDKECEAPQEEVELQPIELTDLIF